jgi:putative ABC transport system permease protein
MGFTSGKMLLREWRGGELGILVAALVVAVAIVTGISAFTTRLQSSLEQESHRFLAADRVVKSGSELPLGWWTRAQNTELASARTLTFPSMVYAGDEAMQLASIKAVSETYPLRGALTFSEQAFGVKRKAATGPGRGQVWLDSRLFPLLDVAVGDSIFIGEASFNVAAAVGTEPDQAASMVAFGPRVLMHIDDIPATAVVQPGSRVEYRLLLAGDASALDDYVAWLAPQLQPGQSLVDVNNGQPGIGSALDRAEQFLLLAGSLGVVLAGVAIALAARRFSERHYDYVAIMKSLGSTSTMINLLYAKALLFIGLIATVFGCLAGWGIQAVFFSVFADQLPVQPGSSGVRPYAIGGTTALVCLLSFAWPPLRRLGQASPLRVLRRDMPSETRSSLVDYAVGLFAVALLMWWYSEDWKLTLAVLAGLLVTVCLGLLLALALLRGGRLVGMSAGSVWRLAFAGLQRRGTANAMQVVIFAMAIMLLLVLVLVRTSLIKQWQTQLPADTPNHFMINITPAEVQAVDQVLRQAHIASEPLFPMIRGRLMSINDEQLTASDDKTRSRRQRESNFTWSDALPAGNTLVEGQWWSEGSEEALVSVEFEFAQRMEVSVGDTLGFLVGSKPLQAKVGSIRELDWQSMRPNFYLIFPPGLLVDYPATFMTSFHLKQADKLFLNEFIRQFPTITVLEMDAVIAQIRTIVDQVSAAIELVLVVILVAGGLVLIAGVQASVDSRMHESAILRALGAPRALILGGLLIEFSAMGFFAGLLATVAAEVSVAMLQTFVLDMSYAPSPVIWPLGIGVGVVMIAGLGIFNCRKVVTSPPLAVLREL